MKDLQSKLEAVKELKRQYYLGTQEIWKYLKSIDGIYNRPKSIAEDINKRLEDKLGEIDFKATPERIVGFEELISSIRDAHYLVYGDIIANLLESNEIPNFLVDSGISSFFGPIAPGDNEFKDKTYEFFLFVNDKIKNTDKTKKDYESLFKEFFVNYTNEKVAEFKRSTKLKMDDRFNKALELVMDTINYKDELFSKENIRKKEKNSFEASKWSRLSLRSIMKRIENDRLDHRLEYRRQVLCKYLESVPEITNYERLIANLEIQYSKLQKREKHEFFKLFMRMEKETGNYSFLLTSKEYMTLRQWAAADKNFLKRFLKQ